MAEQTRRTTAALWLAWVIWGWPAVRIDAESLTVRNAMPTWQLPLRSITGVEGGRRLTRSLADGSVVTAAAVSGDGMAPVNDARPASHVNIGIVLGSIAAVALFVVTVTVLP